ncbi:MAG: hypothetical protein IH818_12635 [Acidobacteria bacterium]|nr:hypothetical protein [Acidobacteriota bacterium]
MPPAQVGDFWIWKETRAISLWKRPRIAGWPGRPAGAGGVADTPTAVANMGADAVWKYTFE